MPLRPRVKKRDKLASGNVQPVPRQLRCWLLRQQQQEASSAVAATYLTYLIADPVNMMTDNSLSSSESCIKGLLHWRRGAPANTVRQQLRPDQRSDTTLYRGSDDVVSSCAAYEAANRFASAVGAVAALEPAWSCDAPTQKAGYKRLNSKHLAPLRL